MKILAIAASLLVISQLPVNAQTLELCRPRTRNPVQRLSQKFAFPFTPVCSGRPKVKLRFKFNRNILDNRDIYRGSDGKRYIRTERNNLIVIPK